MEAKVTIIIPVYNVEKYLRRCLDSVLKQTESCWEAVLVDDGSPDGSGAICEEYAARDSRIRVIHRENGGLSAARNTGIEWALEHSDSEYLTFLDSDDWLHPRFLEVLLNALEATGCRAAMVGRHYTDTYSSAFPEVSALPEVLTAEELFLQREWDFNFAWGKLYRKEAFAEIRYPEGKIFEDVFTTYRVLFAAERVALVDAPLYCYFYNREGISHSPWRPDELVILQGMLQQMAFYQEKGYNRAYEREEWLYVNHHAYQMRRIKENAANWHMNKSFWHSVRKEMLEYMKHSGGKYTFRTMPQCFTVAYPKLFSIKAMFDRMRNAIRRYGFLGAFRKIREKF